MRDFEFSSSERRGNGGPKAPERIPGAKVLFLAFWLPKVQNLVRNQKISEITLSAPRREKAYIRNDIWLLLEAEKSKK